MDDQLVEYGPGEPFPGSIGKTIDDSQEAWPVPMRTSDGTPNVLFYVLDDTGFGQLSPYGGGDAIHDAEAETRRAMSQQ